MSRQSRTLSEEDVLEITRDVLDGFVEALNNLEKVQNCLTLSQKIVDLELGVVSPLYYKLQRHLIDWSSRRRYKHTFGESLKLYEGKKFNEP